MKLIPGLLLLFLNFFTIISLNESISNNPYKSNKQSNPINYKIIILSESIIAEYPKISSTSERLSLSSNIEIGQKTTFTVLHHYEQLNNNSFILFPDFFAYFENSNTKYFILENRLYQMNDNSSFEFKLNLNFSYIDFIKRNLSKHRQEESSNIDDEIIIYGKLNENIYFYSIDSNILLYSDLNNIDTNISCKLLLNGCFICIYSQNNQIKLSILNETNNQNITTFHTYKEFSNIFFSEINEPIIYDTEKPDFKIICGRKKDSIGDIRCILANFIYPKNDDNNSIFGIDLYNISKINTTFSSNETNCNYTKFNSEFLMCCGNIGRIICERRDINLKLINSFNLELEGNIKNLTIENHNNSYVELLYYNSTIKYNNIYGYHIYPPKCSNKNIKIANQSSFKINLDDLFERKTNTNYYLETISNENVIIKMNDYHLNNSREKILLDLNNNELYFEFYNIEEIENFEISYSISINETYSDSCNLSFIFNACYHSCAECSLSEKDSNNTSHNCIKCKENYYHFPNSSNCFNEKEIVDKKISFFLDYE